MSVPAAEARHARRARVRRVLFAAFLVAVGFLLVRYARTIAWHEVLDALSELRPTAVAAALALAATSYALVGGFELFGRRLLGHGVPAPRAWAIGATAYAFNLNLGALVGGMGMRLRLYARHGLDAGTTAQVIAISVTTNWLGYLALAGAAFASGSVEPPPGWRLDAQALRAAGFAMLAAFAAVLAASALSRRRSVTVRGRELPVPTLRVALSQAAASTANWLAMSTLVWVLLGARVPLPTVAAVLLVAAVAGVLTHVPAGLGVLETVFVVLLGDRIPEPELLAALLAYRAIYYLVPLGLAALAWPLLESGAPDAAARGAPP
jgi:hypothetical protein